jgi:predicted GH43/DUF377 family glycosyl hydrolase
MSLPPCRWRGPQIGDRYACSSAKFIVPAKGVPASFCESKCHCVDHEPTAPAIVQLGSPKSSCDHQWRLVSACPHGDTARDVMHCPKCDARGYRGKLAQLPPQLAQLPPQAPPIAIPDAPSTLLARLDATNLPGDSLYRINGSIIDDGDEYVFGWRDHRVGARIHLIRLDSKFRPISESHRPLELTTPAGRSGREDPRLFRSQGRLHVAFAGVIRQKGKTHTNVCYARIGDYWQVEEEFAPVYARRATWEKNWGFFEHDGALYASYFSHPRHQVLRIDGNRATLAYDTPNPFPWSGAQIRGGASPVLHDGEYWHWFHTRGSDKSIRYDMGLIRFEARPPFRITYQSPHPVYRADLKTWDKQDFRVPVWFTGGAVRRGDGWVISAGVHERWSEVRRFASPSPAG